MRSQGRPRCCTKCWWTEESPGGKPASCYQRLLLLQKHLQSAQRCGSAPIDFTSQDCSGILCVLLVDQLLYSQIALLDSSFACITTIFTVRAAVQESKAAAEQKSSSKEDVKEAVESIKQAAKQSAAVKQEQEKAADADSDSDVEIVEEDAPEKGSLSGFYRAIRETGRANVLLALQVILQVT